MSSRVCSIEEQVSLTPAGTVWARALSRRTGVFLLRGGSLCPRPLLTATRTPASLDPVRLIWGFVQYNHAWFHLPVGRDHPHVNEFRSGDVRERINAVECRTQVCWPWVRALTKWSLPSPPGRRSWA
ncbi:hypothetical protein GCM10020219_032490 [Nonomuraea dietziae]